LTTVEFKLGGTLKFLVEEDGYAMVTVKHQTFTLTARGDKMAYTLPIAYSVGLQIAYVDAGGNPAVVDGDVTWASSDTDVILVDVSNTDSTKATLVSRSKVGQAQITATADADLGAGVREIITLMDVTVVAGEAVAGTISPVGEAAPVAPQPA